jgi:putative transposase
MTSPPPSVGVSERARDIALFRYALIRLPAEDRWTRRERGALVRELAEREHTGPFRVPIRVSRVTLDRWIRAWRAGGFEALLPAPRGMNPKTDEEILALAVALKRENPARTAAQVAAVLTATGATPPSARTLQRHFARLELNTRPDGTPPKAYGRFEAEARNIRWTGDALHGPLIGGRKTYLFAFIDDHSRALVGYRWSHSEDTLRLSQALRHGLAARGIPQTVYLDNGAAMVSKQLLRALAVLGIRLTHSRPGEPAGRGKIERFFRTVRDQFLVELAPPQTDSTTPAATPAVDDVTRLNELFTAWVETVYHQREHSETEQTPLARFLADGPVTLPSPADLTEAFQWSHERVVTKTATISLHNNVYQVDAALVGRTVEVVFDPMDMTKLAVRYQGRDMGAAVPHVLRRHVHPDAGPEQPPPPAAPTGIDYLSLLATTHQHALAQNIRYDTIPTATATGATPTGATPTGATPTGATPTGATPTTGVIQLPGQLVMSCGPTQPAEDPA